MPQRHSQAHAVFLNSLPSTATLMAWALTLLTIASALASSTRAPQRNSHSNIINELKKAEKVTAAFDQRDRDTRIKEIYKNSPLSEPGVVTIARLSTEEVQLAFEAANIASFYTNEANFSHDQENTYKELQRRGVATSLQAHDTLGSLISARDFAAAAAFLQSQPVAQRVPLPTFIPLMNIAGAERSELVVSADGAQLTQRSISAQLQTKILVISHPLCHFTQRAIFDIQSDPGLRELFVENSKWIAPQGRDLDFSIFSEWNKQHPALPMTIVFQQDEWSEFNDWDTPVFYFIQDGHVITTVVGWPKEGRKDSLRDAARLIGLSITPQKRKP